MNAPLDKQIEQSFVTAPHFPIYMDYSATTPIDPRVADKMIPYLREQFGNPASRSHMYGWSAEAAVEEARAYRRLMQEFAYTQGTLSEHIGKSRPHISNLLRLLELPEIVREMLADGRLSVGHARPIINLPNVVELAETIVETQNAEIAEMEELLAGL